ncbi:hypothetical protein IQ07DRAFT_584709 [Pyrenochaeta sp. DS3sAY3a]|nr:hypothetical protein IQ07DRAFT_584709 [Pyrenochaeta sp. DS3sAY3a]
MSAIPPSAGPAALTTTSLSTPATAHPTISLFFYGTLQDSKFLAELLSLPKAPKLTRATLHDFKLKTWGMYPIVVSQAGSLVEGMLWEGATEDQFESLEGYEGYAYKWVETEVEVKAAGDGTRDADEVVKKGVRVFVAREPESDEIEEGTWNLEEWRMVWGGERWGGSGESE